MAKKDTSTEDAEVIDAGAEYVEVFTLQLPEGAEEFDTYDEAVQYGKASGARFSVAKHYEPAVIVEEVEG